MKLFLTLMAITFGCVTTFAKNAAEKEWTFLVFLNAHNNLDTYGTMNVNQMEDVGSTDQLNVIVQWASKNAATTKRLYITKDNNPQSVTSPVIEDLPRVDMGDYHSLYEFIKWGMKKYPAKHYFVDVWNHGSGWHIEDLIHAEDISYDDFSGHRITTEELAATLQQVSQELGKKIDIYGSDACLMSMIEVATEMKDAVAYSVGSEQTEPGEGWPYNTFLTGWTKNPKMSPKEVATLLTDEYHKAYNGGIYGEKAVTFSAFDMSKIDSLNAAIKNVSSQLSAGTAEQLKNVFAISNRTTAFYYSDYKDLGHFMELINTPAALSTNQAISEFVIRNQVSSEFQYAKGVSVWLPDLLEDYTYKQARYEHLKFHEQTGWGTFLQKMLATQP